MIPFPILGATGIWYAWAQSDGPGRTIVLVLVVGSIGAWTVMISKLQLLRSVRREDEVFLSRYRAESHPLGFFKRGIRLDGSPLFLIYRVACTELQNVLAPKGEGAASRPPRRLTLSDIGHVRSAMERAAIEESLKLEKNMGILATAVSASPYLGLLGTVWGVMNSFGAMALAQSTAISAVAPGISSALLTTVVGLLVALPSLVGYNFLTAGIRQSHARLENYVDELSIGLEQALQASRARPEQE